MPLPRPPILRTPHHSLAVPLFVLFLVTLVYMIGLGIIIPFLTYLVCELGAADGLGVGAMGIWVAVIMASHIAAQFPMSAFWGGLSDRIGRRPVVLIGLLGNTVFFVLFGLASHLVWALLARLGAGVFNATIAVTRAHVGDISSPREVADRMDMLGAAFGLGFMIGPAIGGLLAAPVDQGWGGWLKSSQLDNDELPVARDGCGAPAHIIWLDRLALAYQRMTRDPAGQRVLKAMATWPEHVGGRRDPDTALTHASDGRVVTKYGAEGVQVVLDRATGRGAALKISDGQRRACTVLTLHILDHCGVPLDPSDPEVCDLRVGRLLNHQGEPVEALVPTTHLLTVISLPRHL